MPKKVIIFGNALLDYTIFLENDEVFQKYGIAEESIGLMEADKVKEILDTYCAEEHPEKCAIVPGGSGLNTARILHHLGTRSTFLGSIGVDEIGTTMQRHITKNCIDARLEEIKDEQTGVCLCLVYNNKSAKHANIGAAEKFTLNYLKEQMCQNLLRSEERRQIIYIEGYFVPSHEDIMDFIMKKFVTGRRFLALSLSAPYIVHDSFEKIKELCYKSLFIFGNRTEFGALIEAMGEKNFETCSKKLMKCGEGPKIIVMTKDKDGVDMFTNYVGLGCQPGPIIFESFCVAPVPNIVDDTGAGDAFVGGFLHAWLEKRQLTECVRMACDIASKVLTQVGCILPPEKDS